MHITTIKRRISALVLLTFTSLTLQPLQAVAQVKLAQAQATQTAAPSDDEHYAKLLGDIKDTAKKGADKAKKGEKTGDDAKTLRAQKVQLESLEAKVDAAFAATEQDLIAKNLPAEILNRHRAAVADYKAKQAEFKQKIKALEDADDKEDETARATSIGSLSTWLDQNQKGKTHTPTDPNKLPFRTPDSKVRAPIETAQGFKTSLFKQKPVHLAGPIPSGFTLPATTLPAIPTADDLAATEDVQITPAIKDQAAQLNNNPVKIYNWVHNNIAFIPSYGSIQGSDMTLQNKRGNAFDTASLLIALYRAAGIPARYVYGTIDVPADKAMNWVGGVTKAEAAQSLLGQGGIPNIGIISGGSIKTIRMEHVWVSAYVDYVPSRGAVNRNPNTWVPMDASFKQYQFTQGMDIKSNVPIDSQTLLTQIQQGATVDPTNGYVQNLNQTNLQTQLTGYQTQVQNYINTQKANATVGDVLGTQAIVAQNHSILLGSLPYKTVAVGNTFQSLPDSLRWKFKTNLYAADGVATSDNPIIELNQSTPSLAGKKITLSFIPATQADQDLINSYLPKPHADGTPIQPSELPTSLPGYLLHMKAEFRVDGQVVGQTTQTFTMGSMVRQSSQYFIPATGMWDGGGDNDIVVGEYDAIGTDLQGIGAQQLQNLQARMTATQTKLTQYQQNPNDATPIIGLTKEDLTGDIVQTGILGYFAQVDGSDSLIARTAGNVKTYRLPSYGRFLTAAQPYYYFGIVRNVTFPGVMMDVDYLRYHMAANDGSQATSLQFLRQAGAAGSAAENAVPEAMFRNPNLAANDPAQPQGVSAVKALAIAASQGQKIYTLNQSNQALHDTILQSLQIDPDVKSEIADALAIGQEVTVHEKDITVNGWTGSGYTLLDPVTGAGAYKIAGGTNGGYLGDWAGGYGTSIGMAVALVSLVAVLASATASIILMLALLSAFVSFMNFLVFELETGNCPVMGGMGVALETVAFLAGFFGGWGVTFGAWLSFFAGGTIGSASGACGKYQ